MGTEKVKKTEKELQEDLLVAFAFCFPNHAPCKIGGKIMFYEAVKEISIGFFFVFFSFIFPNAFQFDSFLLFLL